jgi:hypothetical protein
MYYLQRATKKKAYPSLQVKQNTPLVQIKPILHTQLGIAHAEITKQNSYMPTNIEQETHTNQSHQQTSDTRDLNNMSKYLFE